MDDRTRLPGRPRAGRRALLRGAAGLAVGLPAACAQPPAPPAPAATPPAAAGRPTVAVGPTRPAAPAPPADRARVAFVKTRDRAAGVRQALDLLGLNPVRGKAVLLKPNLNSADPTPGSRPTPTCCARSSRRSGRCWPAPSRWPTAAAWATRAR